MTVVLALDQGTSGTKALVVDGDGRVLAVSEVPVHPTYLADGGVEQDPQELLGSVRDAGRRAVADAGVAVDVVALANQGETVLAWDPGTGEPLSPAVVWQDRRAEPVCAALSEHGEDVARRTGLVLDPYFSAPKMAWLRRQGAHGGVVTTSDAWLVHALTGEFVTDAATASRSLLTDLDTASWDPALLELFGLGAEPLPRIADCDEVVGSTEVFGAPTPVGGLLVDQQAALLAEGCLTAGRSKCTFGTGAFLLANVGEQPLRSGTGLSASVAWRARGRTSYCLDGQVYTAASAVRWLTDLGLLAGPAEVDAVAAEDAGGVLCVPSLAGLAAPWWRPSARGAITGLSLATGRAELVAAVLEGIAAQVAELADQVAIDVGSPLDVLCVDGGLTRSARLMQAVADLLQVRVDAYPSPHATALGVAAAGRAALDPTLTLADAVTPWTPATSWEPRWPADRAQDFRDRWRAAVAATLPAD